MRLFTLLVLLCASCLAYPAWATLPEVEVAGESGLWLLHQSNTLGSGNNEAVLMYADVVTREKLFRTWGRDVSVWPKDLAVDQAGNAVFVANYSLTTYDTYVPTPACVVKVDWQGNIVWEREVNWSDHSILLESVATDGGGNVYATGMAWKFDPDPGPEGWHQNIGFVFTVKLTPLGEVAWARRWSGAFDMINSGKSIVVANNQVVVLAEHSERGVSGSGSAGVQFLWYSAADGALLSSEVWGQDGFTVWPVGLAVNDEGLVAGLCNLFTWEGNNIVYNEILLITYDTGRRYLHSQGWNRGDEDLYCSPHGIASCGDEFFIAGKLGYKPEIPDPLSPSRQEYKPLLLHYNGDIFIDATRFIDYSPEGSDSSFSSVTARPEGDAWLAGFMLPSDYEEATLFDEVYGGMWFGVSAPVPVAAWEEASCASNSFAISGANFSSADEQAVKAAFAPERFYLGSILWNVVPHIPDARIEASSTTGTAPLTITLDASGSTIDEGEIVNYEFIIYRHNQHPEGFDNGNSSTLEYTCADPGTYTVYVTVTSDSDDKSWAYTTITVK